MSFSPLNNYHYKGKSGFISKVDTLSAPWRKLLGGRNICVSSQTEEGKISTSTKGTQVFLLIILAPFSVISLSFLPIKTAASPLVKRQVTKETEKTWQILSQFKNVAQMKKTDEVFAIFKLRPEIGKREDVYDLLFKMINRAINHNTSFKDLEDVIPFLKTQDAIALTAYAIQIRISTDVQNDSFAIKALDVKNFISKALRGRSFDSLMMCYNALFEGVLSIKKKEEFFLTAFKLNLAYGLIQDWKCLKMSRAENQLQRVLIETEEITLKNKIVKEDFSCGVILDSDKGMRITESVFELLRGISEIISELKALPEKCSTQEEWTFANRQMEKHKNKWESILYKMNDISTSIENHSLQNDVKIFIAALLSKYNGKATEYEEYNKKYLESYAQQATLMLQSEKK